MCHCLRPTGSCSPHQHCSPYRKFVRYGKQCSSNVVCPTPRAVAQCFDNRSCLTIAKKSSHVAWPRPKTLPAGARRSCATCAASATWPKIAWSPTSAILRRFFDWLRGRRIAGLSISELSDYPAWLTAQKLAPASISRHVVSLKVFFRYLQLEGVLADNQAELLGTQKLWQRVPTVLSQSEIESLLTAPQAAAALVATRPGDARVAVRHGLPRFRIVDAAAARYAFGRALLPVPRQRRQAARRAAGPPGRGRSRSLFGARASEARRSAAIRPRSSCCSPRAAAECGASASGS